MTGYAVSVSTLPPSMKVPPKRKGNYPCKRSSRHGKNPSMKVPPKRKGNTHRRRSLASPPPLNESPSEKEGKLAAPSFAWDTWSFPSMKVPPKRKGNPNGLAAWIADISLNESPSEKEGKCSPRVGTLCDVVSLNESPSEKEGKCGSVVRHIHQPRNPQ